MVDFVSVSASLLAYITSLMCCWCYYVACFFFVILSNVWDRNDIEREKTVIYIFVIHRTQHKNNHKTNAIINFLHFAYIILSYGEPKDGERELKSAVCICQIRSMCWCVCPNAVMMMPKSYDDAFIHISPISPNKIYKTKMCLFLFVFVFGERAKKNNNKTVQKSFSAHSACVCARAMLMRIMFPCDDDVV